MAKCKLKSEPIYLLELTNTEAQFIKAVMQNPIGCTAETEPEEMTATRKSIFEAITWAGER